MTTKSLRKLKLSNSGVFNNAVRSALAMGVASLTLPGVAFAQQASTPSDSAQLDTIEVTGSRIKRPQLDSASPVTVIERDEILATGITDVGDLLQRMPSMSGSPIGSTTNNGGNGSVQIDLRGMGVNRTLTLVNGKRTVDGGDYQTIPAAMIERVEILKDGGSSVYGADAVAGVVNIITRKDYSGVSLDAQTNTWSNVNGAGQTSINFVTGKADSDGGRFVFGAEYVDQKAAYQRDTPWDFFQDSYYIYPEGCENQVAAPYDGSPQGGCYPIGSSRIPEGRLRFIAGGTNRTIINPASSSRSGVVMNQGAGAGLEAYDGRTYNYAPVNYIQTPYERTNLFASGSFDITKDIRFSTDIRGNFRQSAQELAPQPYNSPTDPGYAGVFNGTSYNGISEDNFYLRQAVTDYNVAHAADPGFVALAFEPISDGRRRMVESTRRFTQDITQFQTVFELSGTAMNMDWNTYYNRGYQNRIDNDFGQFSGARLANALGPSADLLGADGLAGSDGKPECYKDVNDPNSLIPGCVPMNFFGGPFTVTSEMLDYVGAILVDTVRTTQDEAGMSLTGSAFQLPGGPLGWAVGYQYLGQEFVFVPDSGKQTEAVTGNKGKGTDGALYSNGFSAEVLAPVFSSGDQAVNLKAGLRFDDYNLFDSETTWQAGAEFHALKGLKLRGTAGTVFRAPTISELFAGRADSFPTYTDPCATGGVGPLPPGCSQVAPAPTDTQVLSKVGGNRALIPESGNTMTAGIVWTPEFGFGNFAATVDYWKIDLDDGISSYGVQYTLDNCANNQSAASCALITRASDYSVAVVDDINRNLASQGASGIDTEVRYGFSPGLGRLETSILWTHMLDRTKTPFPGEAQIDLSGRYTDPTAQDGGAYAEDKINYAFNWKLPNMGPGNLTVSYLGEYISGLNADTFCNCDSDPYIQTIDSQLYHDLVGEYALVSTRTKLMFGITNVTDEAPPYIEVGFNATTDPSTYRTLGRGLFFRVAQEF